MSKFTAYDLKRKYNETQGGHFFDRSTMKFFGDTMKNYYVPVHRPIVDGVECYALQRINTTSQGQYKTAYFSVDDFRVVFDQH